MIDRLDLCLSTLTKIYVVLVKLLEIAEQGWQLQGNASGKYPSPLALASEAGCRDTDDDCYQEHELMTVKEAMAELNVSRWKISDMRANGELTDIVRAGRVRLIRAEIMAAKFWYSRMKGKI